MEPSASMLREPFSVTATPDITVWLKPALAVGARLAGPPPPMGPPEPLPSLPPQPASSTANPAQARPDIHLRMFPYTGAAGATGVGGRLNAATGGAIRPELCTRSRARARAGGAARKAGQHREQTRNIAASRGDAG